jgi:hypothetical protein
LAHRREEVVRHRRGAEEHVVVEIAGRRETMTAGASDDVMVRSIDNERRSDRGITTVERMMMMMMPSLL